MIASKERTGVKASIKDLIEWLGVNDNRAKKIIQRLINLGVVSADENIFSVTEKGWHVIAAIEKLLDIRVGGNIPRVIAEVRKKHTFYKTRSVAKIRTSMLDAFNPNIRPSAKVVLQKMLWGRLFPLQRFSGAIYLATDYERVRASGSLDDTNLRRAERAELSGILRITRLFALSLPPNLLGEPIYVDRLVDDVGSRWFFAESLRRSPAIRYRYLEQVDALYLARFDKQRKMLSPLHETGLEAYEWLTQKLDSVISSIPDFYQPLSLIHI